MFTVEITNFPQWENPNGIKIYLYYLLTVKTAAL